MHTAFWVILRCMMQAAPADSIFVHAQANSIEVHHDIVTL